MLSMLFYRYNC